MTGPRFSCRGKVVAAGVDNSPSHRNNTFRAVQVSFGVKRIPGKGKKPATRRLLPCTVTTAWEQADGEAFWGPFIHWNTYLEQYVMLLNRAKGKGWVQEGIYISYSSRLDDPGSWSKPRHIRDVGSWYPYVVGLEAQGTDKIAGKKARSIMSKASEREIEFVLSGESRE